MKTIQEFYKRLESTRTRLGISRYPAWYRGHTNQSYQLLPSIMRRSGGVRHERNLFADFKTKSAKMLEDYKDSWTVLAIMQHYGVPTRLLDWTDSLHTALFFALEGNITSPTLWILNPFQLNQRTTGKNVIFDDADKIDHDYYSAITPPSVWPFKHPIALKAPWKDDRILSQRGSFTFHGNDELPLEQTCSNCVKRISIPPHLAKDMRAELNRSGCDYFRLFPDLDGLARSLRATFKF